jgi:3-oxoacyl-[acyl-carrier protein] reductase
MMGIKGLTQIYSMLIMLLIFVQLYFFVQNLHIIQNVRGENGRIVNMTFGQGLALMPGELAYVSSKGAVSAFTRSFSTEVAPLGITVTAVNPGPSDIGWMTDEIKQQLLPKFKAGRIGLPTGAAHIIAKGAEWITGQVIHSEGGFLRR